MEVTILIEHPAAERFRARCTTPLRLETEGATREQAISNLRRDLYEALSSKNAEIATVRIDSATNPWLQIAGSWQDHPDIAEVEENIQNYRAAVDAEED